MKKVIAVVFLLLSFCVVPTHAQQVSAEKEDPFLGSYTEKHLPWFDQPLIELAVRWQKKSGISYVDENGVCNVLMEDSPSGVRQQGYSFIEQCVYQQAFAKKARFKAGDGVEVIRFFHDPLAGGAMNKLREIYGNESSFALNAHLQARCKGNILCTVTAVRGEYFKTKEFCGVVFFDKNSIGHEIKHCFDGDFHTNKGVWK